MTSSRDSSASVQLADVAVRPARAGDREAILALALAMGGHDGIAAHADPMRRLGALLGSHDARVIVAEAGGTVIGFAELQARASSIADRFEAWLGALAIAPQERGNGVGAALVDAVEREAEMLGCDAVVLESALSRDAAHGFYRAAGFAERPAARRFERPCVSRARTLEERFLVAAARAASAVRAAIAGLQNAAPVGIGADGADTEAADARAESAALAELAVLGIPIVSEERGVVGATPHPDEPWISLDPLDGSRNFRAGYAPWATAVGLVCDGAPLAGYVMDLASGQRWWANRTDAFVDGRPARSKRGRLAAVPSPLEGVTPRAIRGAGRVRVSGSTTVDLCRVADGSLGAFIAIDRAVVHVHDLAGPLAVLNAAGATVIDGGGSTPRLVADPRLAIPLIAAADACTANELRAETIRPLAT